MRKHSKHFIQILNAATISFHLIYFNKLGIVSIFDSATELVLLTMRTIEFTQTRGQFLHIPLDHWKIVHTCLDQTGPQKVLFLKEKKNFLQNRFILVGGKI